MTLTSDQIKFLNGVHFAVAATIAPDGLPHQTVVWYALEGDELLLSTPQGSVKHRHLKRDPRLSVCVEQAYGYVTVSGTATLDEDAGRARADYQRLGQRYAGTFAQRTPPPSDSGGGQRVQQLLSRDRVTIRLKIDKVQSNGF